ncbi:hypothetical protein [Aciduricibacillus chroicocephali]|uniref:hypothetical protein n=1 Tax=Aciduricibacillus chroicocephali TaxID=3054939 RepID=UPI003267C7C1
MDMERELLLRYGLEANEMEQITSRLFKATCGSRSYALKKRTASIRDESLWQGLHNEAAIGTMRGVLPVYMTLDGFPSVSMNEDVYYLMPWIDASYPKPDQLLKTIGHIHRKTKEPAMPKAEAWLGSVNTCKKNIGTLRNQLLKHIEKCETRHYMSPFELSFCTQYMEADRVCAEHIKQLEQLSSLIEQGDWHTSVVHGRLSSEHFLNGTTPLFVNWENARSGNATDDLHHFFRSELMKTECFMRRDQYIAAYREYEAANELSDLERCHLSICLLDPMPYLNWVRRFDANPSAVSMLEAVEGLNAHFRVMMFGLNFVQEWQSSNDDLSNPAQVEREEETSDEAKQENVERSGQEERTEHLEDEDRNDRTLNDT